MVAKITQKLHPIVFHCWNGGEVVYNHFYEIIVNENGYSPKSYIMNIVYNFGFIFDSLREFSLFFIQDPRGQVTNVHDAGYNWGLAIFYLITPNLAQYDTTAVSWDIKTQRDYDALMAAAQQPYIDNNSNFMNGQNVNPRE